MTHREKIIKELEDQIERVENAWVRGCPKNGEACVMYWREEDHLNSLTYVTSELILSSIKIHYPSKVWIDGVVAWNDRRTRRKKEVLEVLRTALDLARKKKNDT